MKVDQVKKLKGLQHIKNLFENPGVGQPRADESIPPEGEVTQVLKNKGVQQTYELIHPPRRQKKSE